MSAGNSDPKNYVYVVFSSLSLGYGLCIGLWLRFRDQVQSKGESGVRVQSRVPDSRIHEPWLSFLDTGCNGLMHVLCNRT